jgi:hypothetical protein
MRVSFRVANVIKKKIDAIVKPISWIYNAKGPQIFGLFLEKMDTVYSKK